MRFGKLTVLTARMNPDLAMAEELLKKTRTGNLFTVFDQPDIAIRPAAGGAGEASDLQVEIHGADTPEALEFNRLQLVESLRARLDVLEVRYEIPSSDVLGALRAGALRETAEVSEWLVMWGTYQSAARGRSTQIEWLERISRGPREQDRRLSRPLHPG